MASLKIRKRNRNVAACSTKRESKIMAKAGVSNGGIARAAEECGGRGAGSDKRYLAACWRRGASLCKTEARRRTARRFCAGASLSQYRLLRIAALEKKSISRDALGGATLKRGETTGKAKTWAASAYRASNISALARNRVSTNGCGRQRARCARAHAVRGAAGETTNIFLRRAHRETARVTFILSSSAATQRDARRQNIRRRSGYHQWRRRSTPIAHFLRARMT